MDWAGFGIAVGVAVFMPSVAWLTKSLAARFMDRWFEQGAQRFKMELQAAHDIEIERLRSDLSKSLFEHQTRFSRLHERQLEVLAEAYGRLVSADRAFASWVNPVELGSEPSRAEKGQAAVAAGNALIEYFHGNAIWLPVAICEEIERYESLLRGVAIDFQMRDDDPKYWLESWKRLETQGNELKCEIEKRARLLIDPQPAPPLPSPPT